jgi:SAM-dependent methyltransferase
MQRKLGRPPIATTHLNATMSNGLSGFFTGTEMPDAGWWEALWPDPAGVLAKVGMRPDMEVIDLCSGDGWFTLQVAKIARRVVAIDLDPRLLHVARQRLAESGIENCELIQGDAYDVASLAAGGADFVFLANAFHGVPDRLRLARAVRQVLRPQSRFAIVNWHQRPREDTKVLGEPRGPKTELRLSPEQTVEDVEASGLKLASLVDVPPYHYGAVFAPPPAAARSW